MTTHELPHKIADLRPVLKIFTRRFTTSCEESNDLVQDTIMRALLYKDKFRDDTNLQGWLFTIMRNTFINTYRKNKRAKTLHDTTKDLYFLSVKENHTFNLPDTTYEYKDLWKKIESVKEKSSGACALAKW